MEWLVDKTSSTLNSYASTLDGLMQAGSKLETTLSPAANRLIRGFFGNDVLSAGFFLMVVGSMYTFLKDSIIRYYNEILSWFYVSVEVEEGDECYNWLNDWVSGRPLTRSVRHLTVKAVWDSDDSDEYYHSYDNHKEERPDLVFMPGMGSHVFYHKGHKVTISRERPESASGGNSETSRLLASIQKKQSLTISTFGRDVSLLKSIVQDAMEESYKKNIGKTAIFTCQPYDNYWTNSGSLSPRPFHTVILAKGIKEALLHDIMVFRKSSGWYHERGIPYRRGYLLHGPPGTGKTSFIVALAGHLGLSVCILNLSANGLNDQQLNQLLNHAPRNALILIEDVDAALLGKKPGQSQSGSNNVTLSGLLNALDGVTAHEGSILFMTTNHIKKLAPALIRPGRCDRKLLFDYADSEQVREMFLKFFLSLPSDYVKKAIKAEKEKQKKKNIKVTRGFLLNKPKEDDEPEDEDTEVDAEEQARRAEYDVMIRQQADRMAEKITKDDAITPAQLQGFFMLYREEPEVIVDKVEEFKQELITERKELADKKQKRRERSKKKEAKKKAKKEKERAQRQANGEDPDSSEGSDQDEDDESDSFSDSDYYEEVKSLRIANGKPAINGDGDSAKEESSKPEVNGH